MPNPPIGRMLLHAALALVLFSLGLAQAGPVPTVRDDLVHLCSLLTQQLPETPPDRTSDRARASQMRDESCRLSRTSRPNQADLRSVMLQLGEVSIRTPDVYRQLVAEDGLRTFFLTLQTRYDLPLFASPQMVQQANELLQQIRHLLPEREKHAGLSEEELITYPFQISVFRKPSQISFQANQNDPPALISTAEFYHFAKWIYYAYDQPDFLQLVHGRKYQDRAMAYALSLSPSTAELFVFLFANPVIEQNAATSLRYAESFLTKFCQGEQAANASCLNVASEQLFLLARLKNFGAIDQAKRTLLANIRKNPELRYARSYRPSPSAQEDWNRQKSMLGFLLPTIRTIDSNTGIRWIALLEQHKATAYWLLKAGEATFGERLQQAYLAAGVDNSSNDKVFGGPPRDLLSSSIYTITLSLGGAVALNDLPAAEAALAACAHLFDSLPTSDMRAEEKIGLTQARLLFVLMRAGIRAERGDLHGAQRLLSSIDTKDRTLFPTPPATGDEPPGILDNCETARLGAQFLRSEPADSSELPAILDNVTVLIAGKTHRRADLATIRRVMRSEATILLKNKQIDMLQDWPFYSALLQPHGEQLRQTAKALKCLLSSDAVQTRLGIGLGSSDEPERARAREALFKLLDDAGTFSSARFTPDQADFVLLQAAAILQADRGISAASARAAFKDLRDQEVMRTFEIDTASVSGPNRFFMRTLGSVGQVAIEQGKESLLDVMQRDLPGLTKYADLRNQSIMSLTDAAAALRPSEAAVLFCQFEHRLVVTVVRTDKTEAFVLNITRAALQKAIAQVRVSMDLTEPLPANLPRPYPTELAWALYQQIFQPFEAALAGADTVYLIPGEQLAKLPMAALVTAPPPAATGTTDFAVYRQVRWLGERYAFATLPSVRALSKLGARQPPSQPLPLLAIGQPQIAPALVRELQLGPLPSTARLLEQISKPGDLAPLLGAQANSAGLLSAGGASQARQPAILLFNSHAVQAADTARYGLDEPAILLAPVAGDDTPGVEFFTPAKILPLNLQVRLALLLACETGGGASSQNLQAYSGLVNAFFFAGSDAVLASVLPVKGRATDAFTTELLKSIRDAGLPTAQAVRQAGAAVRQAGASPHCADGAPTCSRDERSVWAHPVYWSLFTLVGSGR